jgi:hypothetical protein
MAFGVLSNPATDPRRQAFGQGVLSLGAQLAQGGQGGVLSNLGRGLGAFQQGQQGALNQQRQDQLYDLQLRGLERDERKAALTEQQRDQMAQAVEEYLQTNQLPPEVDSIVRTRYAGGDVDGALTAASDYVMKQMEGGDAPKTVGGMQWNAQAGQFTPIPGYTDQASAIAAAGRAPGPTNENARQIDALMMRGLPRQDAEDIAYGLVRPVTDPINGTTKLVNIADGTERPLMPATGGPAGGTMTSGGVDVSGLPKTVQTEMAGQAVTIMPVVEELAKFKNELTAVGFVPVIKEIAGSTIGQIPGMEGAVSEDVTRQRTRLRVLRENLLKAISGDVGQGFSNVDRARIEALLPSTGVFESVDQARINLDELEQLLRSKLGSLGVPTPPAGPLQGDTAVIDGVTVEVLGKNADGSMRIRDPSTGRTGTYRP